MPWEGETDRWPLNFEISLLVIFGESPQQQWELLSYRKWSGQEIVTQELQEGWEHCADTGHEDN